MLNDRLSVTKTAREPLNEYLQPVLGRVSFTRPDRYTPGHLILSYDHSVVAQD